VTAAQVEAEVDGGSVRIAVAGEVDLANAATVESQIVGEITNQVTEVTLDLGDVAYIDSAGMRILFSLVPRLAGSQIALELVVPLDSPARRVLELSGLASLVPVRPPAGDAPG
jgi:anti-anti-sigma factor